MQTVDIKEKIISTSEKAKEEAKKHLGKKPRDIIYDYDVEVLRKLIYKYISKSMNPKLLEMAYIYYSLEDLIDEVFVFVYKYAHTYNTDYAVSTYISNCCRTAMRELVGTRSPESNQPSNKRGARAWSLVIDDRYTVDAGKVYFANHTPKNGDEEDGEGVVGSDVLNSPLSDTNIEDSVHKSRVSDYIKSKLDIDTINMILYDVPATTLASLRGVSHQRIFQKRNKDLANVRKLMNWYREDI